MFKRMCLIFFKFSDNNEIHFLWSIRLTRVFAYENNFSLLFRVFVLLSTRNCFSLLDEHDPGYIWFFCAMTEKLVSHCQWLLKLVKLSLEGMKCHLMYLYNTLRPRQNGRHFADDTFSRIFVNENVTISIKFSLQFVPKGPINNIPALVQIMAWRRPGDKPLSGPMMVRLPTHICVTQPQWDK